MSSMMKLPSSKSVFESHFAIEKFMKSFWISILRIGVSSKSFFFSCLLILTFIRDSGAWVLFIDLQFLFQEPSR